MKIEGMQYPLPARPVGHRGGSSQAEVDASDDAVYFEPDERRQRDQHGQQEPPAGKDDAEQQSAQEQLEDQVSRTVTSTKTETPLSETSAATRPPLNITA